MVIMAKNIGFCNGVKNSIDKTIELLNENKKIYEQVANTYTPEWKDLDKNEIIRLASIHKGNKRGITKSC